MKCIICGIELGLDPLAFDEDRQAHTSCLEMQQEDQVEKPELPPQ